MAKHFWCFSEYQEYDARIKINELFRKKPAEKESFCLRFRLKNISQYLKGHINLIMQKDQS